MKNLTRIFYDILLKFNNELKIPAHAKKTLLQLRPETYIGVAILLDKIS